MTPPYRRRFVSCEDKIMTFLTNSPAETEKVGAALGSILQPGTVLAYRGDLGAGKTAFTRGLARGLGCDEIVTSHSGEEIEIGFNCRYLTEALKASMCDKLRLSLSSPNISMVIEPLEAEENDKFIFLVLPCKLK